MTSASVRRESTAPVPPCWRPLASWSRQAAARLSTSAPWRAERASRGSRSTTGSGPDPSCCERSWERRTHEPARPPRTEPRIPEELRDRITAACGVWSSDPALFRALPAVTSPGDLAASKDRALAERLASADQLRPGCSLKEAEDVIGTLTSFAVFDRLHQDGRRSSTAIAEILMRLAGAILTPAS